MRNSTGQCWVLVSDSSSCRRVEGVTGPPAALNCPFGFGLACALHCTVHFALQCLGQGYNSALHEKKLHCIPVFCSEHCSVPSIWLY